MSMTSLPVFLLPIFVLLSLICLCKSDDRLSPAKPLSAGDKLVSSNGVFALGFFSPTNSTADSYIGIWYNNVTKRTYVWVANRDSPITSGSPGKLVVTNNSNLVVSDSQGRTRWTTMNNFTSGTTGTSAILLNSGNFVIRLPNGTDIWQSFHHPTDTILPGMPLPLSTNDDLYTRLVAWRGPDDPATSNYSMGGDSSSDLQVVIWNGTRPYWRRSPWNGELVTASYQSSTGFIMTLRIVYRGDDLYMTFTVSDDSPSMRMTLQYTGMFQFLVWNRESSSWDVFTEQPSPSCDQYAYCGPFGYCDATEAVPKCSCLSGFEPDGVNFSRGCRRKEDLRCGGGDNFLTLRGMKIPDKFVYVRNRSFDQCRAECSRSCVCTAYAYANLQNGSTSDDLSRCLIWLGELVDAGKFRDGENLYLRLASSTVAKESNVLKIVLPIIAGILILTCVSLVWICKSRGKRRIKETKDTYTRQPSKNPKSNELENETIELPYICFEDVVTATGNFSDHNMLGKGGFGKVYKGWLEGGNEVAVKRLSKNSGQGADATRNFVLDWQTRFKVIKGIARGLLYLHQDSRLTIIHRDLKASNVLLDAEMNPKISDFGMARIFGGNEQQANTVRVVGTYGYMSPEYAMEGSFSVKSDTYSFGVLLLEIVSGIKISSSHLIMDFPSLIAYAWSLWKDGNARELVDSSITETCPLHEVLRCIQLGLLCVQDDPSARPLMSSVVFMLENETAPLPTPKEPVYFRQRKYEVEDQRHDYDQEISLNGMTMTMQEGR
ncbi:G-type lectin S-receptor-like serine/threonine-protein kinase B120 isoform X2 [Hordeum vulgare subsp. vulgare]|uniref:G-type lectin S-receptor-like serine/threonine-protein kinase B120 isoform X2 n=1 Tax=Hordeum vulgare subsp. vulgare TaxID=112509 RepID=UPI001D1A353E|nr:G-type lectin S-receptor-like serine/threonine-protein kinase B120 isoform X2 [Hordeum vulgare subsp. vulgare]